ncbi:ABC transporter substrate-binding protein [Chamaesiphon minutus]|uniref:ABC-type Fe3+-hydroxamate transport system, periplasmic component n=1 Tax=Chamaesiphon minutus (strain ATCC 27169 / PCC 6605) TaxID=1173020 RepID=K9UFF3_CHAP6|nr:ABC transporter substrate-binding protein [Chamaesiphon minutus]AFY93373.1 ABC-type Fe3+-hydroxamate transport system, periplasmic component [Chamaesiphon minutus PCC 6605]
MLQSPDGARTNLSVCFGRYHFFEVDMSREGVKHKIKSMRGVLLFSLLIWVSISACNYPQTKSSKSSSVAKCSTVYDREVDYFPNKVKVTQAKGFTVEYHRNYKVVSVKNPWRNADTTFQYVLVQCNTPIPSGFDKSQIVQVPVNSVVSMSTTHLPLLDKLGLVDRLIGVSDFNQVNTPSVVAKIKTGKLQEVGRSNNTNVEKVLEIKPELVTTYGVGNPKSDSHPKLIEAGLPVAIIAEYMESSPLGKAEWLKFMALFFNRETEAEQVFSQMESRYNSIAKIASQAKNKPTVFSGFDSRGTWYIPGGDSYSAKFIADAGGNYIWKEDRSTGSLKLSFEQVLDRAQTAEVWINSSQAWRSVDDVINSDRRYAKFSAVKNAKLFNPTARMNPTGGNDFWEGGTANPDLVLADLVKALHPELLPKHQFVYYRPLN